MFCQKCGKLNDDNALFCYNCGADINKKHYKTDRISYGNMENQLKRNDASSEVTNFWSNIVPDVPGIVFSMLLFATAFFPFISFELIGKYSVKFTDTEYGAYIIVISILTLMSAIFDKWWGLFIGGVLGCGVAYLSYDYMDKHMLLMNKLSDTAGFGFWCLIVISGLMILESIISGIAGIGTRSTTKNKAESESSGSSQYWICGICGTWNWMYVNTCKCGNIQNDKKNTMVK